VNESKPSSPQTLFAQNATKKDQAWFTLIFFIHQTDPLVVGGKLKLLPARIINLIL